MGAQESVRPSKYVEAMGEKFDIIDLAKAQIAAARFAEKHVDLATFHSNRYMAIAKSFGIHNARPDGSWNTDVDESSPTEDYRRSWDMEVAGSIVESCVNSLVKLSTLNPFAGYIEAPPMIFNFYREFNRPIEDGIELTGFAIRDLLVAARSMAYNIPKDQTVSFEDLLRNGLDTTLKEPDERDYF